MAITNRKYSISMPSHKVQNPAKTVYRRIAQVKTACYLQVVLLAGVRVLVCSQTVEKIQTNLCRVLVCSQTVEKIQTNLCRHPWWQKWNSKFLCCLIYL